MRKLGTLAMVILLSAATQADEPRQSAEGPRAAVDQLFLGMHMGDDATARLVLAPDVRFVVLTAEGAISEQSVDGWLRAVAASQGTWNEQIYDVEVRVDDTVASVWAPYTFYLAGRLTHCGVNSIELLRGADGWKITQLSDSRRGEGCPDPLAER
ncbi:MAG: hypothetical protein PVJ80_07500 [Gemmatimonadota bacterium]|jgi:hypothetical protein